MLGVKTLLAGFLMAVVTTMTAANTLTLAVEVYRFESDPGLLKGISSEDQLSLIAGRRPMISQKLELQPGVPAKSSTHIGAFTLTIDASVEPVKGATAMLQVDFSLSEDVPVGPDVIPVTQTVNTKRSLKPGQPSVLGSAQLSSANGVANYQVIVANLVE